MEPESVLRLPSEWEFLTGVTVYDPDGWDRKNWDVSWNTPITEAEFIERAQRSTCMWGPRGGLYMQDNKG